MDNALFLTSHTEENVVVVEVKLEVQSTTVSLCVLDMGGRAKESDDMVLSVRDMVQILNRNYYY